MYQQNHQKTTFTRKEFARKEMRKILAQGIVLDVLTLAITGFTIPYTVNTCLLFGKLRLELWIFELIIALLLWVVSAFLITAAVHTNVPLFCLLFGKYTVELDRAVNIELRDKKGNPAEDENATWKCVSFESRRIKAGIEIDRKIALDETYYLLIVQSKKPEVRDFLPSSTYELIEETDHEQPIDPEQATESAEPSGATEPTAESVTEQTEEQTAESAAEAEQTV